MSYQAAAPLPGRGKRKGGAITFWIGAVLLVVSVAVAVVTGVMTFNTVQDAVDQAESISGDTTLTLQAGDKRTIYQVDQGTEQAECTVTGPDGQQVPLRQGAEVNASQNNTSYSSVADFTATESGDYQVSCEGPRTLVGPTLDVRGAVGGVFGLAAGIGGAFLGLIIALIGAIIWFVGRGESKRALQYRYGPGPGGYGQGGYR